MGIGTKSDLVELFTFLVPGIIIVFLLQMVRTGPKLEYRYLLLHYVVAGVFYQLFVSPLFNWEKGIKIWSWAHQISFFLLTPVLLGLVGSVCIKRELLSKFLVRFFKISINPSVDSAWDYTFSKTLGSGRYAILHLENSEPVYGFIGPSSFIGAGNEGDILIENLFTVDENDQWERHNPPRSLYIKRDCIKSIELLWSESDEISDTEDAATQEA